MLDLDRTPERRATPQPSMFGMAPAAAKHTSLRADRADVLEPPHPCND